MKFTTKSWGPAIDYDTRIALGLPVHAGGKRTSRKGTSRKGTSRKLMKFTTKSWGPAIDYDTRIALGLPVHAGGKRTSRKLRKNSRTKAAIVRVGWTVPGVAEGDARTIREAERAIASERSRVGHLRARIVIHRADGAVERRSNV